MFTNISKRQENLVYVSFGKDPLIWFQLFPHSGLSSIDHALVPYAPRLGTRSNVAFQFHTHIAPSYIKYIASGKKEAKIPVVSSQFSKIFKSDHNAYFGFNMFNVKIINKHL